MVRDETDRMNRTNHKDRTNHTNHKDRTNRTIRGKT